MTKTVFLLWVFIFAFAGISAQTASITLKVKGITKAKGIMNIALFANEEDYSDDENYAFAGEIPVESIDFSIVMEDIPFGTYAIKIFYDEDSNGEFNKNWIGMPKEPFGFSNDAKGRMGPPSFEAAAFKLDSDIELEINLMEL